MGPVKAHRALGFDDLLNHGRNGFQLLRQRLIEHTDGKNNAALKHPYVIADSAAQQILVGKNQLFAGKTADAGRLKSHILHGSHEILDNDEIADDKKFVQYN
ncbi:MAG: hypothetical protein M0036_22055 [Desulfobacteraceae bacterium]|nr:hypothetical protein [Desulfobacteraceae bacterium]